MLTTAQSTAFAQLIRSRRVVPHIDDNCYSFNDTVAILEYDDGTQAGHVAILHDGAFYCVIGNCDQLSYSLIEVERFMFEGWFSDIAAGNQETLYSDYDEILSDMDADRYQ